METTDNINHLREFVKKWDGFELFSTGATLVNFTSDLYNVDGSSDDPTINGLAWKKLLIDRGVDGNCYVTNVKPTKKSSHPEFSVGGHMTTNSDGSVAVGGVCYLMPLCKWHNSTARNGKAFSHTKTSMLKLTGFMQGDIAATFKARLDNGDAFSIVYPSDSELETQGLPALTFANLMDIRLQKRPTNGLPPNYVLFKRKEDNGRVYYVIEDAKLPA